MKKRLLTLGALALVISASAQIVGYVDNGADIKVAKNTLVSTGGGVKTIGSGVINNFGDVKVVGEVVTLKDDRVSNKVEADDAGIVLKLNDATTFKHYGQLWINNNDQTGIVGIVAKEYRDKSHGRYQQMGIPFFDKVFATLNTELPGIELINERFVNRKASGQNVLVYNNALVREDLKLLTDKTVDATEYYIIGATKLVNDANYFSANTHTIKGRPYASGVVRTLNGAGSTVDFGGGEALNAYRQKYKNYLFDPWVANTPWQNDFGKNIYQYANPFLTNIDLSLLPDDVKSKIKGIRYDSEGSDTNKAERTGAKYVSFTGTGTPAGDVDVTIIKPMQEIRIKLNGNHNVSIDFDKLRTFDYVAKNKANLKFGNEAETSLSREGRSSSRYNPFSVQNTVKQLEVIALDENRVEVDRTYYVVYADAITGGADAHTVQVAANSKNNIGTFEELPEGGVDANFKDSYWLYINEANENTFKGKRIPLGIFSDDIKYIKFNIRENAELVGEGVSKLSSGESFYMKEGDKLSDAIVNGSVISVPTLKENIGLYYGRPASELVETNIVKVEKPSATIVVLDATQNNYRVIFDKEWKRATVSVYDLSGRLVSSANNINTANDYILTLPVQKSVYVVEAVSETGKKYVQKIKF